MVYDLVPGSEEGTVAQQQGCPATQRHDSLHPPLHTALSMSGISDAASNLRYISLCTRRGCMCQRGARLCCSSVSTALAQVECSLKIFLPPNRAWP